MKLPRAEDWLWPDWRPHPRVHAVVTTRAGELSPPPWQGFNLGINTGDEQARVRQARQHVQRVLGTDHPPYWLRQVHGTTVVSTGSGIEEADGVWTREHGWPCAVLTADCLPVLLARMDGSAVAALHAGWKGLLAGVLEEGVTALAPDGELLSAWLGPAICQRCYQVGREVHDAFVRHDPASAEAFAPDPHPGHWRLSLTALAMRRLEAAGVRNVQGGMYCTHCQMDRFYSYRYEGKTGRFATLVWLD